MWRMRRSCSPSRQGASRGEAREARITTKEAREEAREEAMAVAVAAAAAAFNCQPRSIRHKSNRRVEDLELQLELVRARIAEIEAEERIQNTPMRERIAEAAKKAWEGDTDRLRASRPPSAVYDMRGPMPPSPPPSLPKTPPPSKRFSNICKPGECRCVACLTPWATGEEKAQTPRSSVPRVPAF